MHVLLMTNRSCTDPGDSAAIYAIVMMSTAVTVAINIREFLAFAGALVAVTVIMLLLYLPAATQIKEMAARTAGSLVGLTAESLEGLGIIQAYQHEEHFIKVRLCNPLHP
jgi:ABC-type multidrug transport system fused ATPase/permease subunit